MMPVRPSFPAFGGKRYVTKPHLFDEVIEDVGTGRRSIVICVLWPHSRQFRLSRPVRAWFGWRACRTRSAFHEVDRHGSEVAGSQDAEYVENCSLGNWGGDHYDNIPVIWIGGVREVYVYREVDAPID